MRSFATQAEARQFFIDKIVHQAQREGVSLSDDERQMLRWSESAEDSVADPALAERLAVAMSDAEYESKIAGLLRNSFNDEARVDPGAKDDWASALSALKQGDHYISVIANEAVGKALKPRWRLW